MEGAATHTVEDVTKATSEAFVNPATVKEPVAKTQQQAAAPAQEQTNEEKEKLAQQQAAPAEQQQQATPPMVKWEELPDEEFEKELARRTKGTVKTLSELQAPPAQKTKEELEADVEAERAEAMEYAFSNGLKRDEYETAIREKSKNNRDIALEQYTVELREINPKASDEEVEESFKDYYMEEADPTDSKRQLRMKEMDKVANAYRKEKTSFLDTIDPAYKEYKTKEQNKKAIGAKIDTVFDALSPTYEVKATYKGAEDKEIGLAIPYSIDDADLKAIKKEVRRNMVEIVSQLGTDPALIKEEDIKNEMTTVLKGRLFDKMMAHVATESANKARKDTEAFYKNIPVRQSNFNTTMTTQKRKVREFTPEERNAMHGGQRN